MSELDRKQRAARAAQALTSYASGARTHLPVLGQDLAVAMTEAMHDRVEAGTAARAKVAADDGAPLACAAGCNACCGIAVMVWEPEALLVARWLSSEAHVDVRAHFLAQLPAWQQALGKDAERVRALHRLGRTQDAERVYFKLRERRVMCAFNREGACTIYPVRPSVCRNTHALETADGCQPGAARGPTVMAHPPLDRLLSELTAMLGAIHGALLREPDGAPEALCSAVARLLHSPRVDPPEPSRNALCPCGSGRKYKHCCEF